MAEPIVEVLQRIFESKEQYRQDLANLPIKEKFKILLRMQRLAAPIIEARTGVRPLCWKWPELEGEEEK